MTQPIYIDEYAERSAYETRIGEANLRKQAEELVQAPPESIEEFLSHDPVAIRNTPAVTAQEPERAPEPEPGPAVEYSADNMECPIPMTMPALAKAIDRPGWRGKYDFGIYSIPKPPGGSRMPTEDASLRAGEINMLFCVARALCIRDLTGREFSFDEVKLSMMMSWARNSKLRKYSDVIASSQVLQEKFMATMDSAREFIEGKVPAMCPKYLIKHAGQKWCMQSLILHMCKTRGISVRKCSRKKVKKHA